MKRQLFAGATALALFSAMGLASGLAYADTMQRDGGHSGRLGDTYYHAHNRGAFAEYRPRAARLPNGTWAPVQQGWYGG